MSMFSKPKYSTAVVKKKDIPKGLYTKDPISGEIVFNKELEDNLMVVPKSGYHFPIGARASRRCSTKARSRKSTHNCARPIR